MLHTWIVCHTSSQSWSWISPRPEQHNEISHRCRQEQHGTLGLTRGQSLADPFCCILTVQAGTQQALQEHKRQDGSTHPSVLPQSLAELWKLIRDNCRGQHGSAKAASTNSSSPPCSAALY